MPFPNWHASRQRDPDEFASIKMLWEKEGIQAYGGPLKSDPDGAAQVQTLRFAKGKWTPAEAKAWLKEHDYKAMLEEANAAATPSDLLLASVEVQVQAAGAADAPDAPKRFSMIAYTGGLMRLAGWPLPIAVDLAGLALPARMPMLVDHTNLLSARAGEGVPRVQNNQLLIDGTLTRATDAGRLIIGLAKDGMALQVSVGVTVQKVEVFRQDARVRVNGQELLGPCIVVRKGRLRETSFVAIGADENTSVQVAAAAAKQGEADMETFEKWLEAQGFKAGDLGEKQTATLKAAYEAAVSKEASVKAAAEAAAKVVADDAAKVLAAKDATKLIPDDAAKVVADIRAQAAAEAKRVTAIRKACDGKHPDIEAKALEEGWDASKAELEVLRTERPKAPAVIAIGGYAPERKVLLATAAFAAKIPEKAMLASYGEQALERAHRMRGMGMKDFLRLCAALDGRDLPLFSGQGTEFIQAAFSTMSVPGILADVANKALLEGYNYVEQAWRSICAIASVNDFKVHNRYRLTGDLKFQKVGAYGELKHGTLGEPTFTRLIRSAERKAPASAGMYMTPVYLYGSTSMRST